MLRKLSWAIALAGVAVAGRAHAGAPRTFDVSTFTPPDGFAIDDKSADHLSMTESAPGRYGVIAVYSGRPASGDLAADFKTQWHDAVEHMMKPDATPDPVRGTLAGGVGVEAGSATATMDGKPVYARLYVVDGGAKVVAVLAVVPSSDLFIRYEDTVGALLASLKVARTEAPPTPPKPPAPPPKPAPAPAGSGAAAAKKPAPPPPPPAPPAYKPVPLPDDPALAAPPAVTAKQLVGEWHRDSGAAPDKDSAIYGDVYTLTAKNKFELRFIAKTGTEVLRESDAGGYAYKDGRLLLLANARGTAVFRLAAWADDKDATTLTLLPDGLPATEGNAKIFGEDWRRAKAKTKGGGGKGKGKH